jgi:hypothetical protein
LRRCYIRAWHRYCSQRAARSALSLKRSATAPAALLRDPLATANATARG